MTPAPAIPLLSYEQPLAPGELRFDLAQDSLTIRWSPKASAGNLLKVCLIALAWLSICAYVLYAWLHFGLNWKTFGGGVVISLYALGIVGAFVRSIVGAGTTYKILATRETLVLDDDFEPVALPMKGIRNFYTRTEKTGDCALVLRRHEDKLRWYNFRLSTPPPLTCDLLSHPDSELVAEIVTSLNALLATNETPD